MTYQWVKLKCVTCWYTVTRIACGVVLTSNRATDWRSRENVGNCILAGELSPLACHFVGVLWYIYCFDTVDCEGRLTYRDMAPVMS